MSATGVVAALRLEARTLGSLRRRADGLFALGDGTLVAVSGMGVDAATGAADALRAAGATALVSWGLAGGLDPALAAGTICLPELVVASDGRTLATDHHWRELLRAAITGPRPVVGGRLLTSDAVIGDPAGKAAAFRDFAAAAVDMESVGVAAIAAAGPLPFLAVRVIIDTAADAIPAAVTAATRDGRVHLGLLLRALLKRPADVGALLKLASRQRIAARALRAVAMSGGLAPGAFGLASASRIA